MSENVVKATKGFWEAEDLAEAADLVRDYFARFARVQGNRRQLAEKYATVVEGMNLTCLGPWGYDYDIECAKFRDIDIPIIRNVAHAVVDTIVSKIGAIDPPLPAMLTNKGNWRARRQAEDLQNLCHAEYSSRKGIHSNLHEVWLNALKLSTGCTGASTVHFYKDGKDVGARVHDTLDMAWSDDLKTQIVATWIPVEDALELYPDFEDEINMNLGTPPAQFSAPTRNGEKLTDFVVVYEAYRGGKKKCVCFNSGPAIEFVDYPYSKPPFVWLVCIPHMYGPLGHSMVHHIYESMMRDNLIKSRVDRAIQKTNESETYVKKGSLVNEGALTSTEDRKVIEINPQGEPPQTVSNPGFSFEHVQVADSHYNDAYTISGMPESHSASTHQQGVPSAEGQRYIAALVNERFARLQRRFIQAVAVDSAEMIVQILCEIYEEDPDLLRLAPGQDTLKEISASAALDGLESLKYVIQPYAISGDKGNPADRMQTAYEFKQLGLLSNPGYAAMQGKGMDLPEIVDEGNAQYRLIKSEMYRWQFAKDEDIHSPDFYQPPFVGMKIGEALNQLFDGVMEAMIDKLEDDRLEFYLMYIADLSAIADAQAQTLNTEAGGVAMATSPNQTSNQPQF